MDGSLTKFMVFLGLAVMVAACSPATTPPPTDAKARPALPPEPVVTYAASDAQPGQRIEHGELIVDVDEARRLLHAQHHPHKVLETRRVPGLFQRPAMTSIKDFALSKKDLAVINPGPGEYVHVMEGQRHGYRNLTIGITYTAPGGAPPMQSPMKRRLWSMGEVSLQGIGHLPGGRDCYPCPWTLLLPMSLDRTKMTANKRLELTSAALVAWSRARSSTAVFAELSTRTAARGTGLVVKMPPVVASDPGQPAA